MWSQFGSTGDEGIWFRPNRLYDEVMIKMRAYAGEVDLGDKSPEELTESVKG